MIKALNKVLSLVLILLALSMLVLWIEYISIQFDREDTKFSGELERDFWIFGNDLTGNAEIEINEKYFSPISVSIMLSDKSYTSEYNKELTNALYSTYAPLIQEVFSSSFTCKRSSKEKWQEALRQSDFVLVEYSSAFPYPTIASFVGKSDAFAEGELCSVKKLLLFSGEDNSLSAMSVDDEANYYSYTLKNSTSSPFIYDFNSNNIVAYTVNKGFIEFVFNQNFEKTLERLPFDFKMTNKTFDLPAIIAENYILETLKYEVINSSNSYFDILENESISKLIGDFALNPHVMGYYADSSSGLVLVGQDLSFSITPEGKIIYTVNRESDTPITVSELINSPRKSFSSTEIMTAATAFLDKLTEDFLTSDSELLLKNATYSNQTKLFTFEFSYYFEKAKISSSDGSSAVTLVFSDSGLVSAEFLPLSLTRLHSVSGSESVLIGSDVLPSVAMNMFANESGDIFLTYLLEDYEAPLYPLWSIKKEGGSVK